MMPVAKPQSKSYKPTIKIVSRAQGLYSVTSESYGGHILYLVDAVNGRCECTASAYGRMCKHRRAVAILEKAFPRVAAPAKTGAFLLTECYA